MNKFEKLIFEGKYDQLLEETKEMNNLDEAFEGKIKQNLSEELKKAYESAKKYKNKAVKPEKRNTKKSFMTKVLETQNQ